MPRLSRRAVQPLIRRALREDAAWRDVTSRAVLPTTLRIRARVIAKSPGILAGASVAAWVFQTRDPWVRCVLRVRDGARVRRGQTLLALEGPARSMLAAERAALNVLGHLSGIATLTDEFVGRVRGTRARIYDTRKTLPGLRPVERYAVRVGGGSNHREDLGQAILIKTNHVQAIRGGIRQAIAGARRRNPGPGVEVEVRNLAEFRAALTAKPDAILLDNWRLTDIRTAVSLNNQSPVTSRQSPLLEVSGGVTVANVRAIARAGVDRISIGRLTHSAPALDVSLRVLASDRPPT